MEDIYIKITLSIVNQLQCTLLFVIAKFLMNVKTKITMETSSNIIRFLRGS